MSETETIRTMDAGVNVETIDGFIEDEKNSIRLSIISAVALFAVGISASGLIYLLTHSLEGLVKFISAIPGLAGTLVSGIPANQYIAKKKRITKLKLFRRAYSSPPVAKEIEDRFWKVIDEA